MGSTVRVEENSKRIINFRQKVINQIDPNLNAETDPDRHKPLRTAYMCIRDDYRIAKQQSLGMRRAALKKLIENDYREMESALLRLGLGFISTHP